MMSPSRNSARKLLKVGVVMCILLNVLYTLSFLVIGFIFGIAYIFAVVAGATVNGMAGNENFDASEVKMPEWLNVVVPGLGLLILFSFIAIVLSIVAIVLINKANTKGGLMAAGILGIIAGIPTIIIPLELIGGIKAIALKDSDVTPEEITPEVVS